MLHYITVLGYGAPADPATDGNLNRYLGRVAAFIRDLPEGSHCFVYLCGGRTNRQDLSEAAAMKQWFEAHRHEYCGLKGATFILLENVDSARDALVATLQECGAHRHLNIFCEWTRRRTVHLHARRLFPNRTVNPIGFDQKSFHWRNRCVQLVKLPLEAAAHRPGSWADRWVKQPLRRRHLQRARRRGTQRD